MSRLLKHINGLEELQSAILAGLIIVPFLGAAILLMSNRRRIGFLLSLLSFFQTVDKFRDLGVLVTAAKTLQFPISISLCVFVFPEIRFRPKTLFFAMILSACGILAIACVALANDRQIAIPVRVLWFAISVAAILTSLFASNPENLHLVLKSLFWGSVAASVIAVFSLFTDAAMGEFESLGRFAPYSANPNQIGIVFAFITFLGCYFTTLSKDKLVITMYVLIATVAFTATLMTISRAGVFVALVCNLPSIAIAVRRPGLLLLLIAMSSIAVTGFFYRLEQRSATHITAEGNRLQHWSDSIPSIIESPFFGFLGCSNVDAVANEVNPHNAYLTTIRLGGALMAVPYFFVYLYGWVCGVQVLFRNYVKKEKQLYRLLLIIYTMQLIHGFVNETIFYPTYTWAFLGVLICFVFIDRVSVLVQREME